MRSELAGLHRRLLSRLLGVVACEQQRRGSPSQTSERDSTYLSLVLRHVGGSCVLFGVVCGVFVFEELPAWRVFEVGSSVWAPSLRAPKSRFPCSTLAPYSQTFSTQRCHCTSNHPLRFTPNTHQAQTLTVYAPLRPSRPLHTCYESRRPPPLKA